MDRQRLFHRFQKSRFRRKAEKKSDDQAYLKKLKFSSLRLIRHVQKAKDQVRKLTDMIFGKETTPGNRISAIAALVYFISPLDFIPDFIPGLGYTEDIAIIGMVVGMITNKVLSIRKSKRQGESGDRPLSVKQEPQIEETVGQNKGWVEKKLDGIFGQVGRHVEQTAQQSVDKRLKAQLIIVAISLSGAILAAGITLLLKYVFKVF